VIFEPEDYEARLVALVPKPRAHLTRYHGVFAPASPERHRLFPGRAPPLPQHVVRYRSATGNGRVLACAVMRWHFRVKGDDSRA